MKRVTGLGGIFFKSKDPQKIKEWYSQHLGLDTNEFGAMFHWIDPSGGKEALTVWSPFAQGTEYFLPSDKPFMFNYRVENLEELLKVLKEEGVKVVGGIEEYE